MSSTQRTIEALFDESINELTRAWQIIKMPAPLKIEEIAKARTLRIKALAALAEAGALLDHMKLNMIATTRAATDPDLALDGAITNFIDLEGGPVTRAQVEEQDAGEEPGAAGFCPDCKRPIDRLAHICEPAVVLGQGTSRTEWPKP